MDNGNAYNVSVPNLKQEIFLPMLWLGSIANAKPSPWLNFKIDGLMLNAYEFISNNSILKKISKFEKAKNPLNEFMRFSGPIMMDSGGYLFQKKGKIEKITPIQLVKFYNRMKPVLGVILDFPFSPNNDKETNIERWKKTMKNTIEMMNFKQNEIPLVPVIHAYDFHQLEKAIEFIEGLEYSTTSFVGLGSLVPLLMTRKGAKKIKGVNGNSARHFVVEAMLYLRDRLPDKLIHVFGIGGTTTMHLMFLLGANSLDSMGWRLKAAYGAVQLPGIGDRFLSKREKRKHLTGHELELFRQCKCGIDHSDLSNIEKSFYLRAIHNAFVFQKELEMARENIQKGRYIEFVKQRLENSPFKKLLQYYLELGGKPPKKIELPSFNKRGSF